VVGLLLSLVGIIVSAIVGGIASLLLIASASNPFTYEELTKRDKVNLDTFWLKNNALEEFATITEDLNGKA
jgi:hypothetical protein